MRRVATGLALGVVALGLAACSADKLNVPNYSNPTPESISGDPLAAVPLLVNGVLRSDRDIYTGYVHNIGILGRESYNYTATEGRNTTGWLTSDVNNQTSFGGTSLWGGPWVTMRNAHNLLATVEAASDAILTPAAKNGVRGFAHTMQALSLLYLVNTRHDLGIPVEIYDDATQLAPFVSRDSALAYIAARLDLAATELAAAGTSFPFTLHSGFAGFTTPATFLRFTKGLSARVDAYRASLGASGCSNKAACYTQVLADLQASFVDPAGSLTTGVYQVYSSAANDVANGNSNAANSNFVAHARSDADLQLKADGTPDNRFAAKFRTIPSKGAANATIGIPTTFDHTVYPDRTSPVAIMRNEELILLRAEARYFSGDVTGALADINTIRTRAGGLPALAGFANDAAFITELLYNRRLSLALEGHRWIDHRRFGRLADLPRDLPDHVVATRLPVPQGECLIRANVEASLKAPGCL